MTNYLKTIAQRIATFAALMACGCGIPFNPKPNPQPNPRPSDEQTVNLKITVDGEGKVNVGGNATITARSVTSPPIDAVCDCGCGLSGCDCSSSVRRTSGAVSRPDAPSGPQSSSLRTERRYVCENGVCRWVDIPIVVQAPRAARVRVFVMAGNPASEAMRLELAGDPRFEFISGGQPPTINGTRWWPTVVTPSGAAWSPASAGWGGGSRQLLDAWLGQQ